MSKIKCAIIGCGRISPNHIASAASQSDKLELVAICDVKENALEEAYSLAVQSFPDVKKYSDYKAMLDAEQPTLAAVLTESGYHAEIGLYCLEKGINLIIEKPIALSIKDADALVAKAAEKNLLLCTCFQNRFNHAVQTLRKALEDNRFGQISHANAAIRWFRDKEYYQSEGWRGTWELDGGALMNQCIHNIDILTWMLGEVSEVAAFTANRNHPEIEAEDIGTAVIKFKSGALATLEGTVNTYPDNFEATFSIFGKTGTARVGGVCLNKMDVWDVSGEDTKIQCDGIGENILNVYGNGHHSVYADVADALISGRKPYIDGQDGKNAMELVLAIYKSSKEGSVVKLPLESFSTLDMN